MRLLIFFFTLLYTSHYAIAQVSYKDPIAKKQSDISSKYIAELKQVSDLENETLETIAINAESRYNSNSKLQNINEFIEIKNLFPKNLCVGFPGGKLAEIKDCEARTIFLTQSHLLATKAVLLAESMSEGERQQVLTKYVAVVNKIQNELKKMELDRDQRLLKFKKR